MLSDFYPHGQIAQTYGVFRPEGTSERAIFVIDKNCIIRYVDVHAIDDQPDNEVLFRVLAQVEGVPFPAPASAPETSPTPPPAAATEAAPARKDVEVIMYCTDWCPACRRARAYFKQHEIRFREINITRDREAAARVRAWANGSETTPTFDIDGTIIVNFNLTRLNQVLGIQNY